MPLRAGVRSFSCARLLLRVLKGKLILQNIVFRCRKLTKPWRSRDCSKYPPKKAITHTHTRARAQEEEETEENGSEAKSVYTKELMIHEIIVVNFYFYYALFASTRESCSRSQSFDFVSESLAQHGFAAASNSAMCRFCLSRLF